MKNKNIKKILSITLTILIVLSISGLSLAYYLARVQGSGKELTSTSGSLSVNYNDEKEIQADNLLPGWTTEKTLTVTNNGDGEVKYNLYWSCIENELERTQDLTYTITENNKEIKTGTFPTEAEEKTIIEQTINKGETKTYTVKIEYIRSNEDQSIDMGKIFKGIIDVQAEGTEQKNSCPTKTYTVIIEPKEEVEENIKEVENGANATFTYTGTLRNPKITCTNNQSGKIEENIITINKVTNNTTCSISSKHTVQIKVENGTTTETNKEVNTGEETTFTTTPNTAYSNPTVTCTNNQKGTIQNNTVTITNITNDTTCTVTYKPITYTITYNLGGGSVTGNPTSYTVETNTITLKNPTKTGYTFTGWTGSNGSTPQTTVTIPKGSTGNKTYTANYKANTYQIKYNANGGAGTMSNSTHTYGEAKTLSTNTFTRDGYTFKGWSTSSSSNTVEYTNGQSISNLTSTNGEVINLYAVWKINTYTVNLTVLNGTVSGGTSKTVNYNTNATFTANSNTGYGSPTVSCTNSQKGSISGNTLTVSNVTNDTTCTVTYKPITYTITYNLNGGSVSGNPSNYTVETNTITLKNPTKTGYTFIGWTGSNGSTAQTTVTIPKGSTGNKSYTANYKANTYQIKYNSNGGTGTMPNSTHTYGEAKTLSTNTFTREGYTFQGWSTSSTSNVVEYTNGQSITNLTSTNGEVINLYAVWKINTYTVKVTVTNGTISGSTSKTVNYNTNATFTVNPTNGYSNPTVTCTNSQKGSISGSTVTVSNVTNNTTCTVTYKPITYTITYNLSGGSVSGNPTSYTVETNTITLKNPSKSGYTFTGWTGSNGTTPQTTVTIPKGSTGNKSYTANYKINTYKVNVTVLNGTISGSTSKTVNYNANVTFTVNPSKWYGNPTVSCTNGQKGSINGNTLTVSNVKSATTCTVNYNLVCINSPVISGSAAEKIINLSPSETNTLSSGGVYKREHEYLYDQISCNTDYRYAGIGPNNYVTFNGEKWRIIGVFETEGEDGEFAKRVKIIKDTYIQNLAIPWDTSASSVNAGMGINQWGESGRYTGADLMRTLNTLYLNRTSGTCYDTGNKTTTCNFSSNGLNATARNMVDTVKWYINGADINDLWYEVYSNERGIEDPGEPGTGETVVRTTFWLGKIALPYVSDYGYADSDLAANSYSGSTELQKYSPGGRNWIYRSGEYIPFITPVRYTPDNILRIEDPGFVSKTRVGNRLRIRPTVYLKPEVKITSGSGTSSRPYQLSL